VFDIFNKYFDLFFFGVDLDLLDFQLFRHFTDIDSSIFQSFESHSISVYNFLDLVTIGFQQILIIDKEVQIVFRSAVVLPLQLGFEFLAVVLNTLMDKYNVLSDGFSQFNW